MLRGVLVTGGGGGAAIDQVCAAGVASVVPTSFNARTLNVCEPTARPVYAFGDVQAANAEPSSEHSKLASASSELKPNVAPVSVVPSAGFAPLRSRVGHAADRLPDVARGLALVAGRVDRADEELARAAGETRVGLGELQASQVPDVALAARRLHWYVESSSPDANSNVAFGPDGCAGRSVIVIAGASVSTVNGTSSVPCCRTCR